VAPALAELNDSGTVGIIGFAFVRKDRWLGLGR